MPFPARVVAATALLAITACETVPLTGRSQLILLPEGTEVQMGLSAYREVLSKGKVSQDPVLNTQVTRVGRRIADATGKNYQWEFKVLEDKQANAFCLPGGKVAVYTGILPITQDDAGLAAVLGHEVAHAIARHGGERVSQTLLVQSTLAATQVALSRNDPQTVKVVTSLLGAGATVGVLLPWSRAQESEADSSSWPRRATTPRRPATSGYAWRRLSAVRAVRRSSSRPIPRPRPGSARSRAGSPKPSSTTNPASRGPTGGVPGGGPPLHLARGWCSESP